MVVARKALDQALNRELCEVISQAKEMAAAADGASDLWKLENWLRERRREIERKYDFRYSVLPIVFATLIKQHYLNERDLDGLNQKKIRLILNAASLQIHRVHTVERNIRPAVIHHLVRCS
jgi:Photoprotection regulator fluorescence recovery protein